MKDYVVLNGVVYDLVRREGQETACEDNGRVRLSEVAVGDTAMIGGHEMVVLEQREGTTALIRKRFFAEDVEFGENNRYDGSKPDALCQDFARELAETVGEEKLAEFDVDLTSDDGLKDYGVIRRKAALLTAEQYRKYVEALDKHRPGDWWWLATPYSTPTHDDADWVKCVSPGGRLDCGDCGLSFGVRPFCILKSDIFVSN